MELKDILEQLEKFVQETMNNSMKENKNQLDYEEGNKLIDMLQKKEVKLMSELEVNIPFADIISVIITLEKNKHHKKSNVIVRDVVHSYSGDCNMLESDINNLFLDTKKNLYPFNFQPFFEFRILLTFLVNNSME